MRTVPDVQRVTRAARLVAVTTVGVALLIAGVILIPLPGPGLLVILAGLAVLSVEYHWARRLRDEARTRIQRIRAIRQARRHQPAISPMTPDGLLPGDDVRFHDVA